MVTGYSGSDRRWIHSVLLLLDEILLMLMLLLEVSTQVLIRRNKVSSAPAEEELTIGWVLLRRTARLLDTVESTVLMMLESWAAIRAAHDTLALIVVAGIVNATRGVGPFFIADGGDRRPGRGETSSLGSVETGGGCCGGRRMM